MKNIALLYLVASALHFSTAYAEEKGELDAAPQPQQSSPVEFWRQGHLDVMAETRSLGWKVTDPKTVKAVETRIVKVAEDSLKPTLLYRSDSFTGEVDLMRLSKEAGLYAILSEVTDASGKQLETGMRFSYAELNPECPDDQAWWSDRETVDFQTGGDGSLKETADFGSQNNLLRLAQRASHAVMGVVTNMISCPTKEGSLFTYVILDDVKTLQKEGNSTTPTQLILRIPGGMAHGRVEIVTDAPVFRQGDQTLLFLNRDPQAQIPIVGGADGVLLIDKSGSLRSYSGPNIVSIDASFDLQLDPGYQLDEKHIRHYDPNMRAVIDNLNPAEGIGKSGQDQPRKSLPALSIDQFAKKLTEAWSIADRTGRLPRQINATERRSYNDLPALAKPR